MQGDLKHKISKMQKESIANKLKELGAKLPCPRCGNKHFTLLDGYLNHTVQKSVKEMVIGGESLPSVVVVCKNCGFMSQHALGILGLLEQEDQK